MSEIKKITVLEVGANLVYEVGINGVSEIHYNPFRMPGARYTVEFGADLKIDFDNCPLMIEYVTVEGETK